MPSYDYVCPDCGAHFERNMSFRDVVDITTCPNGHKNARRVFTPPAVVYKGSGFYVTDHRPKENQSGGH